MLVASSPTLFSVVAALAISRRLRVPYVFEVRDLWPAIFVELGVIRNRFAIGVLERLELALYRRARAVVTVTRAFADDIEQRGIDRAKLHVIPTASTSRRSDRSRPSRRCAPGSGSRTSSWCCTAAPTASATRWAGILEVAAGCGADARIHFLFVGEGAEKDALVGARPRARRSAT